MERTTSIRSRFTFPIFVSIAIIAVLLASQNVFFWDTIQLGSKHAHWYYEQQFQQLLLPAEIDSGHPPVFGMYLALCWMVFGKTLIVSHLAMLPFVWASVWGAYQLGVYYGNRNTAWLLLLFLFVDPTFAAQHILVSPDVIIAAVFMIAWYAILHNARLIQIVALLLMTLVSMRGMMVVAGLYVFDFLYAIIPLHLGKHRIQRKFNSKYYLLLAFRKALLYVPAGLVALFFLIWHYQQTGWIGYHADSSWAPSFEKVDLLGFIKNIVVLIWRLVDFGRIFVWVVICCIIAYSVKKFTTIYLSIIRFNVKWQQLFLLVILLFLVLTPSLLLHKYLSAHRYLLPLMICLTVLVYYLIVNALKDTKWQKIASGIIVIGLLSGNFWIYPKTISQGWDSTLAHLPHYELRTDVLSFLEKENIALDRVGTAFPEIGALKYKDLSDRNEGMVVKDLEQQDYIYYSNIMNEFSDMEIANLEKEWDVIAQWEKRGVVAIIYKKKRLSD